MLRSILVGAAGYPLLEICWRGRTHWTMALAGGASMALIRKASALPCSRWKQAMLCGAGITAVEYLIGKTWNRDYRIWDYRRTPMNVQGQICLPYTLVWCALSAAAMAVMDASAKGRA